jgi:hypothetical protein
MEFTNLGNGVCTPIMLESQDNSGNPGMVSGPLTVTFSTADSTNVQIYVDSTCETQAPSPIYPNASSTISQPLFVQRTGSGPASVAISASTTTTPSLAAASANLAFVDVPGSPTPVLKIKAPATILAHECYRVAFQSWHVAGNIAIPVNFSTAAGISLTGISGLTFSQDLDPDCQNLDGTSTSLNADSLLVRRYFKYSGTATSLNLQSLVTSFTGTYDGGALIVSQPGTFARLKIIAPSNEKVGNCFPIKIRAEDASGHLSPPASTLSINLSSNQGGSFYSMAGCYAANASLSLAAGQAQGTLWFQPTATGPHSITAQGGGFSTNHPLNVAPATFNQLMVVLPGETFTSGSYKSGSATPVLPSTSVQVTVYAVKYDLSIDTNAQGALLQAGSQVNGSTAQPAWASINFTNGVATFQVTPGSPGDLNVNLVATSGSGYASTSIQAAATNLNLYMSQTSFATNSCQPLMVVPETASSATAGYSASVATTTNYSLSAIGGGGFYSDPGCNTALSVPALTPGVRKQVFFYKTPTTTGSQSITLTPTSGTLTGSWLSLNISGTSSNPVGLRFIGRTAQINYPTSRGGMCEPYLVIPVDSSGNFVYSISDLNLNLEVLSVNGTVGAFTAQCFNAASPVNTGILAGSGPGYFEIFLGHDTNSGTTTTNRLRVSDGGLGSFTRDVDSSPYP